MYSLNFKNPYPMNSLRVFCDFDEIAEEIARCWCEQAMQAASDHRIFSVVLSGGSTGPALYGKLAEPKWRNHDFWEWVHIFFADERCVPPNDEGSNYKIVSHYLLNHISIPAKNIHRMRGEENPKEESLRYSKDIQNHLEARKGKNHFFDWVFLGLGLDGHTASLFPGNDSIDSKKLCEVAQHPKTGQKRITMTPYAINKSSRITYHVVGERKAEIVSKLASHLVASNISPVSLIQGEWFLDKAAASKVR